jgi:hypothetical protein
MGTVETQGQFQDIDPQSLPKEQWEYEIVFSKDTTHGRRVAFVLWGVAFWLIASILTMVMGTLFGSRSDVRWGNGDQSPKYEQPARSPAVTNSVPGQNETEVDIEAACTQLSSALEEVQALWIASPDVATNADLVLAEPITTKFNEFSVMVMTGPAFDAVVTVRDTAQVSVDAQSAILEWSFTNCGMEVGP